MRISYYKILIILVCAFIFDGYGFDMDSSAVQDTVTGYLNIRVYPSDAKVMINNDILRDFKLVKHDTGVFTYTVSKKYFYLKRGEIHIIQNDTTKINVTLAEMQNPIIIYFIVGIMIVAILIFFKLIITKDRERTVN